MTSRCQRVAALVTEATLLGIVGATCMSCRPSGGAPSPAGRPVGPITFNRDVAPILFQSCAPCHRPGQSAPFDLLSYMDARRHAEDIVRVTQKRYMPPWLPEPGYGEFVGERRLKVEEIEVLRRWVDEGTVEGAVADLPPMPKWSEEWQLGAPDLVLQMSQPYALDPEGRDVYRNFVIPIPMNETRYVRAVEFRPGNRSIHHVRMLIDQQGQSRRRDAEDAEPGFEGMRPPARFPPGHMLTWAPGTTPAAEPDGLSWTLEPDTDLVLQLHLQRTGKPELVSPLIGLYFTDQPPTRTALVMGLLSQLIDIPPGESRHVVERSFQLPADVEVFSVLPHLHYLGRQVQGFARLPDGSTRWLIRINQWDFNWQGAYRYSRPVFLPRGAVVTMRYTYDNSAENPRNPNRPPRRVGFGPQSTDEMGELWLQVLPNKAHDLALLQEAKRLMDARETAAFYENFLLQHPGDAPSHVGLAKVLGPLGRSAEAARHFRRALELDPHQKEAHYYLGLLLFEEQRFAEARAEFESELRLDPNQPKAHVGLSMICIEEQDLAEAEKHVRAALQITPRDSSVQEMLARILKARTGSEP